MNAFLIALQFLSRFPVPLKMEWDDKSVAASLLYYPLVGVLIGFLLAALAGLLSGDSHVMLAAALVLAAWVIISGGLHLDGLADSADAWMGSQGNKQRALEIMKDPQAGPIAVVVLILVLLIKFSALYSLIKQMDFWMILLPVVMGRCVPLVLFLTTPYVREQGLGSAMARCLPQKKAQGVLLLAGLFILVSVGLVNGGILIAFSLFVLWLLRRLMLKHIDGMTGDTIGGAIEIIEALALCLIVFI